MKAFTIFLSIFSMAASAESFRVAFTDVNGLQWSKKLESVYANTCSNEIECNFNPNPTSESPAQKACLDLGGRLPTESEAFTLLYAFPHYYLSEYNLGNSPVAPTSEGLMKIYKTFDISKDTKIWTSYYIAYPYAINFDFHDFSDDSVLEYSKNYEELSVICVRKK